MADDVQVTIGASIDDLLASVDQAKSIIGGLGAAFGVGFSITQVEDFIASMGELATHIERTSAILGISTASAQELGVMSKATGGDADSLTLAMERLGVGLAHASNVTGPQAQALKSLGLTAAELVNLPLDEKINKIADAMAKFGDGTSKTTDVLLLMGRGAAGAIPFLDQGSVAIQAFRERLEQAGTVMSTDTIKNLHEMSVSLDILKASATSLGGTLVGLVSGGITAFDNGLAQLIGDINIAIQTHTLWERMMLGLEAAAAEVGQALVNLGTIAKDVFTLNWGQIASDRAAGLAKVDDIQQEYDALINAHAEAAANQYKLIVKGTMEGNDKPQAPEPDLNAGKAAADASKAAMASLQSQIQVTNTYYQQQAEGINTAAKLFLITENEKTEDLVGAVKARLGVQIAALDETMVKEQGNAVEVAKLIGQRVELEQKAAKDIQKINDQAAIQTQTQWIKSVDSIANDFNSQLRGLLSGTETWAQAMQKVVADMVLKMISSYATLAIEMAATGNITALKQIAQQAGVVYANVFATLSAVMGPLAAVPAGAAGALVLATGAAFVGKYETGTDYVPQTGLALVHQGEAITPASENPAAGGTPNGVQFHFNAPIIGSQAFVNNMIGQIAMALKRYQGLNPSAA
jgi:hypothetical protein